MHEYINTQIKIFEIFYDTPDLILLVLSLDKLFSLLNHVIMHVSCSDHICSLSTSVYGSIWWKCWIRKNYKSLSPVSLCELFSSPICHWMVSVILIPGALNAQMSVSESICTNIKLTADVDIQMTENHKWMQMKYVNTFQQLKCLSMDTFKLEFSIQWNN